MVPGCTVSYFFVLFLYYVLLTVKRTNVKGILNWKTSGSPNQLFYKGTILRKPQELAEAQNDYFLDKILCLGPSVYRLLSMICPL